MIPAGTAASLRLPAAPEAVILEGGQPAEKAEGIRETGSENGRRCFEIGSGCYEFLVKLR